MKTIQTTVARSFDTSNFPDWLSSMSDEMLKEYFKEHPTSKYNPFAQSDGDSEEEGNDDEEREEQTEHSLPLLKRLTFKGWSQSAPTKELKDKTQNFKELVEDLDLDRLDYLDTISDIKEQIAEDKDSKAETNSPRRKKRLSTRIFKSRERIKKLRSKLMKIKSRTAVAKKRIKMMEKSLKSR